MPCGSVPASSLQGVREDSVFLAGPSVIDGGGGQGTRGRSLKPSPKAGMTKDEGIYSCFCFDEDLIFREDTLALTGK